MSTDTDPSLPSHIWKRSKAKFTTGSCSLCLGLSRSHLCQETSA